MDIPLGVERGIEIGSGDVDITMTDSQIINGREAGTDVLLRLMSVSRALSLQTSAMMITPSADLAMIQRKHFIRPNPNTVP